MSDDLRCNSRFRCSVDGLLRCVLSLDHMDGDSHEASGHVWSDEDAYESAELDLQFGLDTHEEPVNA